MHTSPVKSIRERAYDLYDHLAEKHQTFIYSKNSECVKRAFEYQQSLSMAKGLQAGDTIEGI
jgi:hypothetical protein